MRCEKEALSRDEVRKILSFLEGPRWLMGSLIYGAGLGSVECVRLRVKDVDFARNRIRVRSKDGDVAGFTCLPPAAKVPLRQYLPQIKQIHERDLSEGFGRVYLPVALEVQYPGANAEWGWQYVFPASRRSKDPRSGVVRRHHIHVTVPRRAVREAARQAGVGGPVSCRSLLEASVAHRVDGL